MAIYIQHTVLNATREQFYLQCRINLRKKVQPQSTTKLLTRYHSKCKIILWQTNFIPSTLTFTPTPTLPSPTHNASLLIFILKRWTKERGSFSILCRIMSRKVAAVHLLRNIKSQITSKWSQLFVALHRKIQSKCVLNLAYLTRVINR